VGLVTDQSSALDGVEWPRAPTGQWYPRAMCGSSERLTGGVHTQSVNLTQLRAVFVSVRDTQLRNLWEDIPHLHARPLASARAGAAMALRRGVTE